MAVKVSFLSGASTVTVSGLHQWDYGQTLEIECTELGSEIVEVHFACTGMSEAIVRPCTFANGVGTVIIPDRCLEQTSNITAWIYKVDSSAGHTIKTVILPVIARTRPGKAHDVPSQYVDKYAEAIAAINTAVEALESGNVTVAKAVSADTATTATTANLRFLVRHTRTPYRTKRKELTDFSRQLFTQNAVSFCIAHPIL